MKPNNNLVQSHNEPAFCFFFFCLKPSFSSLAKLQRNKKKRVTKNIYRKAKKNRIKWVLNTREGNKIVWSVNCLNQKLNKTTIQDKISKRAVLVQWSETFPLKGWKCDIHSAFGLINKKQTRKRTLSTNYIPYKVSLKL